MRRMVGDERWEALPARTREQRRAEGPALLADMHTVRSGGEPPFDPAQIHVPVVVAHGSRSVGHHRQTAETLAGLVPGAELVVVEGAAHGVHLTHPQELATLARRAIALAGLRS